MSALGRKRTLSQRRPQAPHAGAGSKVRLPVARECPLLARGRLRSLPPTDHQAGARQQSPTRLAVIVWRSTCPKTGMSMVISTESAE